MTPVETLELHKCWTE